MATLKWTPVIIEPEGFVLIVNEGQSISLSMSAVVDQSDEETPTETYSAPTYSLGTWNTPDGYPPVASGAGFVYTNPGISIPGIEYKWVTNEVESTAYVKADVAPSFDFLTACIPNSVVQYESNITINATVTGSLGTELTGSQTYTIFIRNNWDGDKADLYELLARGHL